MRAKRHLKSTRQGLTWTNTGIRRALDTILEKKKKNLEID